ncbi:MAG: hypothetical protein WDO06_00045 [Actinomycetota bacterium]
MEQTNKGLTKPGVVVIQTFIIALATVGEIHWREGVGVVSGIAICFATFATIRFARLGTAYVAAATAPLAFAVTCIASLIIQDGIHPSRLGIDIVSSFASAAPYLILSAIYGWFNYFRNRKVDQKSKLIR